MEIARLEVRDYLTEAGAVREESVLPAAAAINGQARPLLFASARLVSALDAYLEQRRRHGHGTTPCCAAYRGLDPESRLFLCATGAPLTIKAVTAEGVRQHRCGVMPEEDARASARSFNRMSACR